MPARKPKTLIVRHETAAEAADRAQAEEAMQPGRALPALPPRILRGMKTAEAVWRRLIRLYDDIDGGKIATRLDMDLLTNYCIMADQVVELDKLRRTALDIYAMLEKMRDRKLKEGDEAAAAVYATKVIAAYDSVVKIDGRADRKRAELHKMQQSLYLTPRARAGVAPKDKDKKPEDPFEKFLDQAFEEEKSESGDGR